jgi:nucleoid-associated protein YgaU
MGIAGDTHAAYISAGELRAETEQALDSLFGEVRDVLVEARGLEFLSDLGLAHDPEVLSLLQLHGDVSAEAEAYLELLWVTILKYYRAVIGEVMARQVYSEQPYIESPPVPPLRHTVAFGETLWSISLQYLGDPARWREILEYNNLRDQTIIPGQILLIPRE